MYKNLVSGRQIVAARALVGISQEDLSTSSGVSVEALNRLERGKTQKPHRATLKAIADHLIERGVEFMNGSQPGVRLQEGTPFERFDS